jgi:hypothetical protein
LCDQVDFQIDLWNAGDTQGFQFKLGFDGDVLDFHSAHLGPFLSSTGRNVTVLGQSVTDDVLTFAAFADPGMQPLPRGDGELATVRFEAVGAGVSPLDLHDAILTDGAFQVIDPGDEHRLRGDGRRRTRRRLRRHADRDAVG